LNIIILFVIGKILSVFLLKGVKSAFIMELPLYHKVNFKTVSIYTYSNIKSFVSKAASIIVIVSALIWIFNVYPSVDDSYLSKIGKTIEPLGKLMGFEDYRVTTALLTSFVAKENTIATFGVLYKTPSEKKLQKEIGKHFTFPSAISFLIVQMLFIPCLATVIAITKEKGRSLAFISILIQIFVSLLFGILSYNILRIFYA